MEPMVTSVLRWVCTLFAGLLLGLAAASISLKNDPRIASFIESRVCNELAQGLGCSFTAKFSSINPFMGNIQCKDMDAHGDGWSWHAEKVSVQFSWIRALLFGSFRLLITVYNPVCTSNISQDGLALQNHINRWITMPEGSIPIMLESLVFVRGSLIVEAPEYDARVQCEGNATVSVLMSSVQVTASWYNALITAQGSMLTKHGSGSLQGRIIYDEVSGKNIPILNFSGIAPLGGAEIFPLLIKGDIAKNRAVISVGTHDRSMLSLHGVYDQESIHIEGSCTLAEQVRLLHPSLRSLSGTCKGIAKLMLRDASWDAFIECDDLSYGTHCNLDGTISLEGKLFEGRGIGDIEARCYGVNLKLSGPCSIDFARHSALWNFENYEPCMMPILGVADSGTICMKGSVTDDCVVEILYKEHELLCTIPLSVKLHENEMPFLSCTYRFQGTVMALAACNQEVWKGSVAYSVVRGCIKKVSSRDIPGEGLVAFDATINNDNAELNLHLTNAHIRIPHTFNVIEALRAKLIVDVENRSVCVQDAVIILNKGEIEVPFSRVVFDALYEPSFVNAPILIKSCFIHLKKDFYSTLSGILSLTYRQGSQPIIKGNLVLDTTTINRNLLASNFERDFTKAVVSPLSLGIYDAQLDLAVLSKNCVSFKTPMLEVEAGMQLSIKGNISSPQLYGMVALSQGVLNFPYQPLYITSGKIYFLPSQLEDPLIQLTAKNKIKKYTIGLTLGGSLKNPKIMFDASPTLTENQIIMLLLGGSEDGGLFLAMPVSLTSTIEGLIFGSQTTTQLQKTLTTLFKPFKNVRIVPRFSDEAQRGGIRGSLMIEVNDNLRANIQNNVNLSEDTRIEVEYSFSDTMNVRAFKNERGDRGVELEKVWKFGG